MRLVEFAVTGYKNLSREVRLTDLGHVNVIHGDNNVGKSNLLEALQLFFVLLGRDLGRELPLGKAHPTPVSEDQLHALTEHTIGDIFDLRGPTAATIWLEATFSVDADSLRAAGIKPLLPTDPVVVALELTRAHGDRALGLRVTRFLFADGSDAALYGGDGPESPFPIAFFQRFALFLARNALVHDAHGRPAFALIEENRRIRGEPEPVSASILSPAMLLALWDASTSTDPQQSGRWKLLRELVTKHLPPFERGELLVAYDRHHNEAFLMLEERGEDVRIRHRLLGTGVQQVLGVLGLLLVSDARFVAIEEPECNLRYALQLRLREALRALTLDPRGPQQLFITSHSPAFETEAYFYAMRLDDQGIPMVERRPAREARRFVGVDAEAPPAGATGEVAWVSSDGLVVVPPHIRPRLDVETGGEVAFLTNTATGRVEILSEREFLDLLGPEDDPAEDP